MGSDNLFAPKSRYVDVGFLGQPRLIATGVLESREGLLLVDPGPETSMDALAEGLEALGAGWGDVRAVLLTHIHLDHAGATGAIVAEAAEAEVYVHRKGARHLVDPERLWRSAERLYGEHMERLWGSMRPVPADRVTALDGGESFALGERHLRVAYTPGHASHHVSYLDEDEGTAFIGDVGQQRITGIPFVFPVTPPPDVDVEAWRESLQTVRDWGSLRTFVTHFGPATDVEDHLRGAEEKLVAWSREVLTDLRSGRPDDRCAAAFRETKLEEAADALPRELAEAFETFGGPEASWHGLARYWRKHHPERLND